MIRRLALPLLAAPLLALAACEKQVEAPVDRGMCYMVASKPEGVKFNPIAHDIKDMEHCAVELERARLRLARLGSNQDEMIGAFQGGFIFLRKEGIFTSTKFNGSQYLALVRYRGELVMPGAIVEGQPAPAPSK